MACADYTNELDEFTNRPYKAISSLYNDVTTKALDNSQVNRAHMNLAYGKSIPCQFVVKDM